MSDISISQLYKIVAFRWSYSIEISEGYTQWKCGERIERADYSSVTSKPELISGLLWNKIVFPCGNGKRFKLSGIKKLSSEASLALLTQKIGNYHTELLAPIYQQIKGSFDNLKRLFSDKYVSYSKAERWKLEHAHLVEQLENQFSVEFLSEVKRRNISKFLSFFSRIYEIREKENQNFISEELRAYKEFFDKVESNPLTDTQRLACVVNEDNNLVLAGAGSGKTSVVIAKAGYLIKAGLALPNEILILAYGRKASQETDERISEKLPSVDGVKTSTFHKMGLDIIGEATQKKPRVSKLQEDRAEFYKLSNRIISDLTRKDHSYNQRVIDYFVTHLIPYKDEFKYEVQGEYFAALKEHDLCSIKSRIEWAEKRNGRVSLQQEQLKSFEEVVIADFLFVNGVKYIYEHPYEIDTASSMKTQYQPDFYLPDYDVYIEHFGIDENGKTPPFVDQEMYVQGVEWKRHIHREHNTKLVETYSYEMREGTLTDHLYSKLENHGVEFNPKPFHELLELLIGIGGEKKVTQFNKLIIDFLDLFKQSGDSIDSVRGKANRHPDKPRCHAFLDVFEPIYNQYCQELEKSGTVDFSDMIRKATELVQAGKYRPKFKYILVDEFQDISAIRAELVKALVSNVKDTVLMCVGDDWQSIYRFSGSDINYISKFEENFGFTERVLLDKTFRFNDKINSFSTNFITQNPAQIKKNVSSHTSIVDNGVTLVEFYQDVDTAIQVCVENIHVMNPDPATIYILGRYSFSKPSFLQTVAKSYPDYKFVFDTVHASKGKEEDFVILVDVNDARYGFPSKVVDEPLLELVLPTAEPYEHAEERRLFYVAITRSKHHSFILYDKEKPSKFIQEIGAKRNSDKYSFNKIRTEGTKSAPPDFGNCTSCITGKITMRVMHDGRFFFGCGHYPFCDHTPRTCNSCNKFPLVKDGNSYRCKSSECGNVLKACPHCTDGVMEEKTGKYGKFLGCSNYAKTNCRHTEKLH